MKVRKYPNNPDCPLSKDEKEKLAKVLDEGDATIKRYDFSIIKN